MPTSEDGRRKSVPPIALSPRRRNRDPGLAAAKGSTPSSPRHRRTKADQKADRESGLESGLVGSFDGGLVGSFDGGDDSVLFDPRKPSPQAPPRASVRRDGGTTASLDARLSLLEKAARGDDHSDGEFGGGGDPSRLEMRRLAEPASRGNSVERPAGAARVASAAVVTDGGRGGRGRTRPQLASGQSGRGTTPSPQAVAALMAEPMEAGALAALAAGADGGGVDSNGITAALGLGAVGPGAVERLAKPPPVQRPGRGGGKGDGGGKGRGRVRHGPDKPTPTSTTAAEEDG
jgi:hypothetical protein